MLAPILCLLASLTVLFAAEHNHVRVSLAWALLGLFGYAFGPRIEASPAGGRRAYLLTCCFWSLAPALLSLLHITVRGGFDIVWFSQAVYNVAAMGQPWVTIGTPGNHMGYHFEPVLYPLGWLSGATRGFMMNYQLLMASQMLAALTVVAVAMLPAKPSATKRAAAAGFWLPLVFLPYWGFTTAQHFEFHPVTLGGALGLASLAAFARGRLRTAYFLCAATAACGEMFLVSAPVQACFYFVSTRRLQKVPAAGGLLLSFAVGFACLFYYVKSLALVWLGNDAVASFPLLGRYQALGTSFGEVLLSPITKPATFFAVVASADKLRFFALVALALLSAAGVAVLQRCSGVVSSGEVSRDEVSGSTPPPWLAAFAGALALAAPAAKILFSPAQTYTDIGHHYVADMLPALGLLAFAVLLLPKQPLAGAVRWQTVLLAVGLGSAPYFIDGRMIVREYQNRETIFPRQTKKALHAIPGDVAVFGNDLQTFAELSQRRELYFSFTPAGTIARRQPELLVLGWPALHGITTPNPNDFGQSFAPGPDGLITAKLADGDISYALQAALPAQVPGSIYVYERR